MADEKPAQAQKRKLAQAEMAVSGLRQSCRKRHGTAMFS